MASFEDAFSSASPVLVLPPQFPPHSYSMNNNNLHYSFNNSPSPFTQSSSQASSAFSTNQSQLRASSTAAAGRKRSRAEAADNLNDEALAYHPSLPTPASVSEADWEYGEGMTLVRPNGFIIDASSQTGTWAEEEAEKERQLQEAAAAQSQPSETPILRSYKSQRLDNTATGPASSDEVVFGNGVLVAPSPPKSTMEPTVDDFTIHLGVGWSRLSDDEHIQAAARGWAKFIENHYPVSDVSVRLQSKGLASYLVEAKEGYFLFGEDLKQGRLVSVNLQRTFGNLRSTPPVFDGETVMIASTSPTSAVETKVEAIMTEAMVGTAVDATPNHAFQVEMDMS